MRRARVHAVFAGLALACAGYAGYEAVRLVHVRHVDAQVLALSAAPPAPAADPLGSGAATTQPATQPTARLTTRPTALPARDEPRRVQLARAVSLAAAGQYGAAGHLYETLVEDGPLDEIGQAALFDLANMYLREGAGPAAKAARSLPMIEQAKARYRALLRVSPGDWDARYNLERALRLAPETANADDGPGTTFSHNVKVRGAQSEDLP